MSGNKNTNHNQSKAVVNVTVNAAPPSPKKRRARRTGTGSGGRPPAAIVNNVQPIVAPGGYGAPPSMQDPFAGARGVDFITPGAMSSPPPTAPGGPGTPGMGDARQTNRDRTRDEMAREYAQQVDEGMLAAEGLSAIDPEAAAALLGTPNRPPPDPRRAGSSSQGTGTAAGAPPGQLIRNNPPASPQQGDSRPPNNGGTLDNVVRRVGYVMDDPNVVAAGIKRVLSNDEVRDMTRAKGLLDQLRKGKSDARQP